MLYQEFRPCAALQPYVDRYWCSEYPQQLVKGDHINLLPSGQTEWVFCYGDPFTVHSSEGKPFQVVQSMLGGPISGGIRLSYNGCLKVFAVRFHTTGMHRLTNLPMHEVTNSHHPLDEVFGRSTRQLVTQILEAPSAPERVQLVEGFLLKQLQRQKASAHFVDWALEWMAQQTGPVTVQQLAEECSVGSRQLERLFEEHVGLSPRRFLRIIRFNRAMKLIHEQPKLRLTEVTYTCGYADQAHFSHDFKTIAGASPRSFFSASSVPAVFLGV